MPFPMPRPISGSRFAPKIRMMINRMMMSSGIPRRPIMAVPFGYEERGNSITLLRFGGGGLLGALLAAALASTLVSAQFSSGVNLVEVYAAVTDQAGDPATRLGPDDFPGLEEGHPQKLTAVAERDVALSVA